VIAEYTKKWLVKANRDLMLGENELTAPRERMVTEAICFHSQQAVEKFLKGYLVTGRVEFGKTHNLAFLLELCGKEDAFLGNLDVADLSFYAVEVRYPDEFYTPTLAQAHQCVQKARTVRETGNQKSGRGSLVREDVRDHRTCPKHA